MADTITLVATERGFHGGKLVQPGQAFAYPAGRKLPKWAAPAAVAVVKPVKPLNGDTKPDDVRAAVRAKAEGVAKL